MDDEDVEDGADNGDDLLPPRFLGDEDGTTLFVNVDTEEGIKELEKRSKKE